MQQALHRSSLVPSGFVVESACYEGDKAIIAVRASGSVGLCPSCGTVSPTNQAHDILSNLSPDQPLSSHRLFRKPRTSASVRHLSCRNCRR